MASYLVSSSISVRIHPCLDSGYHQSSQVHGVSSDNKADHPLDQMVCRYHGLQDKRLPPQFVCFDCRLRRSPEWDMIASKTHADMISRFKDLALFRYFEPMLTVMRCLSRVTLGVRSRYLKFTNPLLPCSSEHKLVRTYLHHRYPFTVAPRLHCCAGQSIAQETRG